MDTPIAPVPPQSSPNKEAAGHTVMGVLSYLGVLVIIPYLMSRDVPFVKFHIKQGVVLAITEIILWAIAGMFWGILIIINILHLALIVLSIVGIVNVVQNKEKELPLVGSFAKYINI